MACARCKEFRTQLNHDDMSHIKQKVEAKVWQVFRVPLRDPVI